jgi:hypothetical protein
VHQRAVFACDLVESRGCVEGLRRGEVLRIDSGLCAGRVAALRCDAMRNVNVTDAGCGQLELAHDGEERPFKLLKVFAHAAHRRIDRSGRFPVVGVGGGKGVCVEGR